jgi:hypothetical protein
MKAHILQISQGYSLEEYHGIEDPMEEESRVKVEVATPDRCKLPICPNGFFHRR